jgi:hypothetical protein
VAEHATRVAAQKVVVVAETFKRKFTEDLLKAAAPLISGHAESASATETYKPGQVVPRDGTVECALHHDVQNHVKAGTRFAPCSHHHEHSQGCSWQYG